MKMADYTKPRAVLVVAGCGGLGKGVTEHLAEKGWAIFPTTRKTILPVFEKGEKENLSVFPVHLSFEDFNVFSQDMEEIFCGVESQGYLLHGVVYCAASRMPQKHLKDLQDEDWMEEFRISTIRFAQLAFAAASRMRQQGIAGSLVALGSLYGHHAINKDLYDMPMLQEGLFSGIPYAVSKAALEHLVRCLALEFGKDGIRVNVVAPGGIENSQRQTGYFQKKYTEKTPLRRLGRLSDIPGAVAYLLSEEASYVTGHVLPIDGGWGAQ